MFACCCDKMEERVALSCLVLNITGACIGYDRQANDPKKKKKTHFVHNTYDMHLQA